MKLKALFLALAVAGAGASFALADDGHHKAADTTSTATTTGTTTTTSEAPKCPHVELKGTFGTVGTGSFTMTVARANHEAKALVGQTATVAVDAKTRVSWDGVGTLTGPNAGDLVVVHARQCAGSTGPLTAQSVKARAAKADSNHDSPKK
jgi:hypothetical protein